MQKQINMQYKGTATILSGKSGNGKTTFAEYLKILNPKAIICTADDFFMKDGVYHFSFEHLGAAHKWCKDKFEAALEAGLDVICANTNTKLSERGFYIDKALAAGYRVFSLTLEDLGHQSCHSVPEETLERQKGNLKNSFRF